MVQSKPLRLEWLPAVALSSALALLMLIWSPPVGDLAAQVFRTELFQRAGLAILLLSGPPPGGALPPRVFPTELFQRAGLEIWNGSWYGGHSPLPSTALFPPLGALLGPQVVGGLAVVSSSYLFDRLVRDR